MTNKVEVSYIEIYNEKVRDLLCPRGYVTGHFNVNLRHHNIRVARCFDSHNEEQSCELLTYQRLERVVHVVNLKPSNLYLHVKCSLSVA